MAVQNGAILNIIAVMNIGKYCKLNTKHVNPISPAKHLRSSHPRSSTGTSLTKCFPEALTVNTERERLMKVRIKHKSMGFTPEFVATFDID
jgi:hypothetical protein